MNCARRKKQTKPGESEHPKSLCVYSEHGGSLYYEVARSAKQALPTGRPLSINTGRAET
jgi:hypothetical protein